MLTIDKKNLSSKTLLTLRKLASIINPEYSEKLGRHFSVYGIPRILCEYIEDDNSIKIPRGLKDKLFQFTSREAIDYIDERCDGDDLDISFKGKLYSYQQEGADTLLKNEIGILEAEPGFGKTIIALYIMSIINKNTLIIVNSRELLKQWKEKIDEFIDYPLPKSKKEGYIGEFYSQKKKLYNHIDIALIQSLSKLTDFDMLKHYGLVIVDECHHASANIYRTVLREINAHYIYSFSTTPERKDKLEKITYMYLGNIVYEVNHDEVLKNRKFEQILIPRNTTFKVIDEKIPYNEIIDELYQNVKRNHLIISDINKEIENNKNIIVLTDRKNHMDILYNELQYYDYPIFCMSGDNSTKEKEKIKQEINNSKHYLLIATSQLLGEGFDLPSLNTMFMTMPISYQGRLKQYTGRLHRNDKRKTVVTVYDYVDSQVRVLQNMFQKRLKEYKNIGYRTQEENNSEITENTLFDKANYEYFLQHAMSQAKKNIVIFCNDCKIYRIQKLYSFLISLIARNIKVYVCLNKDYDEDILSYIEGVCTRILSSSYHINAIMIDEQELWTSSSSYLGIQSNDLYYIKTKDKDVIEELKIKIES